MLVKVLHPQVLLDGQGAHSEPKAWWKARLRSLYQEDAQEQEQRLLQKLGEIAISFANFCADV
jgi:hypothetical protein